jgi:hypothetical protein
VAKKKRPAKGKYKEGDGLPAIVKLYCENPECPYRKRKGWAFGTIRLAEKHGPSRCKHCGGRLEEKKEDGQLGNRDRTT